ncbi:MAG: hypothetical protein PHE54_03225 [Bacilli bacterium]|nr:hypothetical protein [Bacilli bacterium]
MFNQKENFGVWTLSVIKNMDSCSSFLLPDGSVFSQYNSHKNGSYINILYGYNYKLFCYYYDNFSTKKNFNLQLNGFQNIDLSKYFPFGSRLYKYNKVELLRQLRHDYNHIYEKLLLLESHKYDGPVIFLPRILLREYINHFFVENSNQKNESYKAGYFGNHPVNKDVFDYLYNLIKGELLICRFFLNLVTLTDEPALEFIKYLKLYGLNDHDIQQIFLTGVVSENILTDQLVNLINIDKIETQISKTITTGKTHRTKILREYIYLGYQIKKIPSFFLDFNSKQIVKKREYYPF